MKRGRRGHPCEPDTSTMGPWQCPECGQHWEIHGIAGTNIQHVRVRRVNRVAWFFAKWFA